MNESLNHVRETKFELLRILLMLVIIAGHLFMANGVNAIAGEINRYCWYLLGSGSRIAVNVFLMLGVWFMVDARFSARRILSLYAEVVTYSVPLTLLVLALGYPVATKEIWRGLMPFWGRGLWFASAYIVLLFWAPFLKQAFRLSRRAQSLLLGTLLLFTCITCTVPDPQLSYALDLYWFACIYLFIGYVKHETDWTARVNPIACLSSGLALYGAMVTMLWYGETHVGAHAKVLSGVATQWLVDFKTLPNLIASFLTFMGVAAMRTRQNAVVNALAAGTFGVYVLHCVPAYSSFQFVRLCRIREWGREPHSWLWGLVCVFAIFLVYSLVDRLRARFIAPIYLKSRWFGRLCDRLDRLYESRGMRV